MNGIPTYAEYGSVLTNSKTAAVQRGSGNFNPPPKMEQSTNRGNAYMNAFDMYKGSLPLPIDTNVQEGASFHDPQQLGDDLRKRAYSVGNTGFHSEQVPWTRPEFEGAQNQYVEWALKALVPGGITPTPLILYFFSTENVNYIQDRVKMEVKKHTGITIDNQSIDEILIIMRNHILYAYSGWLPSNTPNIVTDRGPKDCSLEDRLSRLNKSVIEELVKQVLSGIQMYKQYMKDQGSLPMPLSHGTYTSMKGSRELSPSIGFNSGHERTLASNSYNMRFNLGV